jgi:hypothetical protein
MKAVTDPPSFNAAATDASEDAWSFPSLCSKMANEDRNRALDGI